MRIKKEVGHVLKLCLQTLTSPSITDDSKRMFKIHLMVTFYLLFRSVWKISVHLSKDYMSKDLTVKSVNEGISEV